MSDPLMAAAQEAAFHDILMEEARRTDKQLSSLEAQLTQVTGYKYNSRDRQQKGREFKEQPENIPD